MIVHEIPVPPVTTTTAAPDSGIEKVSQLAEFNELVKQAEVADSAVAAVLGEVLAEEVAGLKMSPAPVPVPAEPAPGPVPAEPAPAMGEIAPRGGKPLPLLVNAGPRPQLGPTASGPGQAQPGSELPSASRRASLGWIPAGASPAPTGYTNDTTPPLAPVPVPRGDPSREANSPLVPEQPIVTSEAGARSRIAPVTPEAAPATELEALSSTTSPNLRADAPAALLTRAEPSPVSSWTLAQPIRTSEWGNALGQRITWMTRQDVPVAELRLNPPELGPLEVRIAVNNSEASVHFGVQHAAVRDAIDSAIPRLREMLANAGLQLVDVDVSGHDGRRSGSHMAQRGSVDDATDPSRPSAAQTIDAPVAVRTHTGFIDSYV